MPADAAPDDTPMAFIDGAEDDAFAIIIASDLALLRRYAHVLRDATHVALPAP